MSSTQIENIVRQYGDLVFDLCESVLWSGNNAQLAFRSFIQEIDRKKKVNAYRAHERAWVLRVAWDSLRSISEHHTPRILPSEQLRMDADPSLSQRFKNFDHYFHRLSIEDQVFLLLKDKYGLPYPEIAAILQIPEGSLKVKRQQALRTLEEWLWDNTVTE